MYFSVDEALHQLATSFLYNKRKEVACPDSIKVSNGMVVMAAADALPLQGTLLTTWGGVEMEVGLKGVFTDTD